MSARFPGDAHDYATSAKILRSSIRLINYQNDFTTQGRRLSNIYKRVLRSPSPGALPRRGGE